MPRRARVIRKEVEADAKYHSLTVSKLINRIMMNGSKRTAERIVYDALQSLEQQVSKDPVTALGQAIRNVTPLLEVKPRRVGGATYQVPMEVPPHRRFALATRWILAAARSRSGRSFPEKLAAELMDAANNQGSAIKKREETHKMAEANRAFSHYRL